MSQRCELRVGGVPEHFNAAFHIAQARGLYEKAGIDFKWTMYPGGTGAMAAALNAGEIDTALMLSEGAVAKIASGDALRLCGTYVSTPLVWGAHVKHGCPLKSLQDLRGRTFGISRYGSGSHLMTFALANKLGWDLEKDISFKVVGSLDGAREAMGKNEIDVFLWEKFTTKHLVDSEEWDRAGEVPTPWSCFCFVASEKALMTKAQAIQQVVGITRCVCEEFKTNLGDASVRYVSEHHKLGLEDAREWLAGVSWACDCKVESKTLSLTVELLKKVGQVPPDCVPDSSKFLAPGLCVLKGGQRTVLRVGGVPEHFNAPFHLAHARGLYEQAGVDFQWTMYPGGTGAMAAALNTGEIDTALMLSEGAVAKIACGDALRLCGTYVSTPLVWGAHVKHGSPVKCLQDMRGRTFGISRYGSGSHLMAFALAKELGWDLSKDLCFKVVGSLDGARDAMSKNEIDVFLWEKFTTKHLVDSAEWQRAGEVPTPWPCFCFVASENALSTKAGAIHQLVEVTRGMCHEFKSNLGDASLKYVSENHKLSLKDAGEWLAGVSWACKCEVECTTLSLAFQLLSSVGQVPLDCIADPSKFLASGLCVAKGKGRTCLRVGGVPEHFNAPFHLAHAKGLYDRAGIDFQWTMYPGGTGAMAAALNAGEVDVALMLSEGAVAKIATGDALRLCGTYVGTPLIWGAHVKGGSAPKSLNDLRGRTFGISRYGSGSHLMAYILANELSWDLDQDVKLKVVGSLDGARTAIKKGEIDVFLWEKFTTKHLVDSGEWGRAGEVPTPWSCFCFVSSETALRTKSDAIRQLITTTHVVCEEFKANVDDVSIRYVSENHKLGLVDAREWLSGVVWTCSAEVDAAMLDMIVDYLKKSSQLDAGCISDPVKFVASELCMLNRKRKAFMTLAETQEPKGKGGHKAGA